MSSAPAAGRVVRGNTGCEEGDADKDGSSSPDERDVAALEEEVQNPEDQHKHSGLCKEGRAATRCDGDQFGKRGVRMRLGWGDQTRSILLWIKLCCVVAKHKNAFVVLSPVWTIGVNGR